MKFFKIIFGNNRKLVFENEGAVPSKILGAIGSKKINTQEETNIIQNMTPKNQLSHLQLFSIEATNIDIFANDIANKVHQKTNAIFYSVQLEALQIEAERLGFFFARNDTAAIVTPLLAERLASVTAYKRFSFLYPNDFLDWDRLVSDQMENGYAPKHLVSLLEALAELGIRLQESPQATVLLKNEEEQKQDKEMPVDVIDLSLLELEKIEIDRNTTEWVNEFFLKLHNETMTDLEKTIISMAQQDLEGISIYFQKRSAGVVTEQDLKEFHSQYDSMNAMLRLGKISGSGMSSVCIQALQNIEDESAVLFRAAV